MAVDILKNHLIEALWFQTANLFHRTSERESYNLLGLLKCARVHLLPPKPYRLMSDPVLKLSLNFTFNFYLQNFSFHPFISHVHQDCKLMYSFNLGEQSHFFFNFHPTRITQCPSYCLLYVCTLLCRDSEPFVWLYSVKVSYANMSDDCNSALSRPYLCQHWRFHCAFLIFAGLVFSVLKP